jgi:anti-sigma factor RsiW
MKYMNLIDRYLFGQLSPEEELLFERQLSRDPALAEETARRFREGKDAPFFPLENIDVQDAAAERSPTPLKVGRD